MSKKPAERQRRIVNRKATHDYHILERLEVGIVLAGTEVKSLRAGAVQLTEAWVRVTGHKTTLYGLQIDRYPPATDRNHEPNRSRRLLLHRREIDKLTPKLANHGTTLIPLSVYFNDRGIAKVELGLAIGKKTYDKREALKKRDHQREMDRATKRR